ncbi:unnamed protein product, partial [Rotaria magnacalcarata]
SSQLDNLLRHRNSSSSSSNSFWYRSKLFLKPSSSSLHAFLDSPSQIVKESNLMCNIAADHYEEFFKASNIVRPHPYTDSPAIEYDNINEIIPESVLPSAWKDTRMILLAKTDSICLPSLTRPISLLDSFAENRRGLLLDSQSGFRERFRLQTRLLLFLEDIICYS